MSAYPQVGCTDATPEEQQEAVENLINRLLPEHKTSFGIVIRSKSDRREHDKFEYASRGGKVVIQANSGVAAASGLYHFLKYECLAHVSWSGNQLKIPSPFPEVDKTVKISSPYRFRYYQNVCTSSYSFVWWDWNRWEKEIDWMVLSGINLALAFTGQEAIWQRVYLRMGLSQSDLDEIFGGPAFLAWSRMGNIHGWGGPLPPSWHEHQLALQHRILARMRSFGISPVLPAFNGYVPRGLVWIHPEAAISQMEPWILFSTPKYTGTHLLDAQDPLFQQIGKAFIEEQIAEFGTSHIYSADTFNENRPKSQEPSYLSSASKAVFEGMTAGDPDAIWLMQGWLFYVDRNFWRPPQVKGLLNGVPRGRMIILDLFAETSPVWKITESFYGHQFIWCMLQNFGGTHGLHGAIQNVTTGPVEALKEESANIVGTGLTPEGIGSNDVMFDLMNEMGWKEKEVDLESWVRDYSHRRYGGTNEFVQRAWSTLLRSVYSGSDWTAGFMSRDLVISRPSLNYHVEKWFDEQDLFYAWDAMIASAEEFGSVETFRYDLVDVSREALVLCSVSLYMAFLEAYQGGSATKLCSAGSELLKLFDDMDSLLSSNENFLLGRWLESARALATNEEERKIYEYNARNQITLWGPNGDIHDYAGKQWGGLINTFYKPRWELFISQIIKDKKRKSLFDPRRFAGELFKLERDWTLQSQRFPDKPVGDSVAIAQRLHQTYGRQRAGAKLATGTRCRIT